MLLQLNIVWKPKQARLTRRACQNDLIAQKISL